MATQFERAAQRGLLKCVERLGKFVEIEDADKQVSEVYEKETDTTSTCMFVNITRRHD
jgi:adenylate cyclase class IV